MSQNKVKISIRTKLFLLILIAFTAMIITTSWQIGLRANRISAETIDRSLQQSSVILDTKIESRTASIKETAFSIARDGRILPLVFDKESLTLQDQTQEFQRTLNFDILFFTDDQGIILARSDRPEAIGFPMAGKSPLFDKALAGAPASGVLVSQGKLLQIVVVPIFDNVAQDLVRGTTALAYEFSKEMADEILALTASDIGFLSFTRNNQGRISGVKTTYNTNSELAQNIELFFSSHRENWESIVNSKKRIFDMQITLGEDKYFTVVHVLKNEESQPLGFIMVLRSRTELMKPFIDIQRIVIIVGFICLIIASIFAWIFSLRLSRPIINLVKTTSQIQEGDYSQLKNDLSSNDEIGLLQNAVIQMGNNLREKAELENYLAQLSDELDRAESFPVFDKPMEISETKTKTDNEESTQGHIDSTYFDEDETLAHHSTDDIPQTLPDLEDEKFQKSGEIIDARYTVIRSIGSGGMGTVYLARDNELEEEIAIKIMSKAFFNQQESINFKEEIRLARQITHRNILRTFDFGQWKDFYYITMEYVSGYDLGFLLKTKGAFDTHIGVIMARQICSAMNAAHEQGIIHRDLKPSNMIINRQGILKIMDFGLAMKVRENDGEKRHIPASEESNGSTTIAGTPRYMAPEQFFNWNLDERSDIYAIGVILYALFNGQPPFQDKDFNKLAMLHLEAKAPPIEGKSGLFPPFLQSIITKALAKKPEDRYQSVRELIDELSNYSNDQ